MKAVVVMFIGDEKKERLTEIRSLCKTANYEVADVFIQKGRPSRRSFIRKGKVREINDFTREEDIQLVVFENFLTSGQILALEDEFKVPVIDRFDLILNVFELHAASREAKLQIELARLKKKIPYLKMYLSRKVKSEHPGFGGSGEFIIHSTLTTIHRRIKSIEGRLERFEKRTAMQRDRRKKTGKIISLAGYTNVGKTSLLYALTGVKKPVKDELFTTLGTKTASFSYNGSRFLLNDTIGFIRNLPYQLIYAFNATLMDIASSDLVLIIHDASLEEEELLRRKEICEKTLTSIGANEAKWLNVENKIDVGKKILKDAVGVSAETGEGIETLKGEIHRLLSYDK
jgi:GTP-binding protein HflX